MLSIKKHISNHYQMLIGLNLDTILKPVPSIREHPLHGPVSVPRFRTGHFPSHLSPENETGIPEFEISGKFGKNSRNSVLDGKFPVGY